MKVLPQYSIEELASKAGVSRRTVRYYVQRGLLPAPWGLGRGRHYGEEHLAALLQAKVLQERGLDLEAIRRNLAPAFLEGETEECDTERAASPAFRRVPPGSPGPSPRPPGEGWFRQRVLPGYELHVGAGERPLSAADLAALSEFLKEMMERGGR